MTPNDDRRDEELLASFLNTVERDMAPPDQAFLDRLREQSTEAYRAAFAPPQAVPAARRRRLAPWLAVGLAAAVLVGIGVYLQLPPRASGAPFGEVLDKAAAADGLHLKVVQEGDAGEAWVRNDRLRRDHADGTYEIADAGRLWVVDEKDNRVTPRPSPYFRKDPAPRVDLLALLGLDATAGPAQLVRQRPAGHREEGGTDYLVYRVEVSRPDGKLQLEALVDAGTLRLHSVQAQAEKGGKARPLGQVTVLAWDEKVPEQKFVVKDTLTEDGRVGKVVDVQGVVSVRPVLQQRWTPVGDNTILRPGDWVRTDVRGANAVLLRLVKQTTLVLGPGALVEVVRPDEVCVHQGEVEATVPKGDSLDLVSLGGESIPVKGRLLYRFEEGRVVRLEKEPLWLKGFKGAVPQESLGSLLARVDGRDVPLTVGYHKVTVDVRDQIARTTIEESFVNHTDGVLEGVFHFPLPQDASISGFGMWVGDNLIEADVVEKQRAREIYETILTEKRDPGLLEWTGGNVFKARVYPIPGHAEKRIKITYTQVLPLRDGRYRFSYALQSEMLKEHPLRQLDIDVKVSSALPLRSVTSPTHTTRNELTEHAAHVEFSAQEYVPTRDFEVVVEVDGKKQPPVVLIPHRRGDEGYFLMQILPPAAEGGPERTLVPDGPPLRLLVLADTSASMDAAQRRQQAEFLAALLGSLTSKDTVNLACCDVDCDWAFEKPQPAGPQQLQAARQFLAQRTSLGWTDLDRAFASAFRKCEPGTQILYIGDAVVTAGDADPVAFARRLRRLYQEQGHGATCHAVAVGSTFEPGVLAAIGSLGGGSARRITGEQGPVAAAREWLREAARPGLRDLKVEFKGLRTARVYPEELPNLPAGSQQIVLGRYLPEGKDQTGEVIVTGRLGNQPVRYSTRVPLKDAEGGNSFIPRLWARMHLDRLLAQGSSAAVRDEVIALSEEYQIITPYTSLLVLESDADRARFGVKRTFHMRDGEKFFAEGRADADYELLQKQMKRAGDWRLGLRRLVLRQLASLGRDPRALQVQRVLEHFAWGGRAGDTPFLGVDDSPGIGGAPGGGPMGGEFLGDFDGKDRLIDSERGDLDGELKQKAEEKAEGEDSGLPRPTPEADEESPVAEEPASREPGEEGAAEEAKALKKLEMLRAAEIDGRMVLGVPVWRATRGEAGREIYAGLDDGIVLSKAPAGYYRKGTSRIGGRWYPDPRPALDAVFPQLPPAPRKAKEPTSTWPADARDLVRSLLRTEKLARLSGGVEILRQTEVFDARRGRLTQRARRLELFTPGAWLTRAEDDRSATVVQWCDGGVRGVLSRAFRLGRLRSATAEEGGTPPLELHDFSLQSLERSYPGSQARVEAQGNDRVVLTVQYPNAAGSETRCVIDTGRHVLLSIEQRQQGKVTSATKFDDFVEAAGGWWARRVETVDESGRRTLLSTQTVKDVTADELRQRLRKELADRDQVQFLREPLPRVADAKRALQGGKAGFEDHLALLRHFAAGQQWTRALEHLEKAEALAAGKPGMRWLRDAFLSVSRRHEELRKRLLDEADQLAKSQRDADDFALTEHLVGQGSGVLSAAEMLLLLDRLHPVYEGRPPQGLALERWGQLRVSYLQQAGRSEEALRLQKQLATDYSEDMNLQRQYAQALAGEGDFTAAYDWLKRALKPGANWLPEEEEALRDQYAALLYQQGRYADLADYLADWVKREPTNQSPYLQYLSALIRTGQIDKASDLIARWLKEGQVPGELPPPVAARLQAAVAQALGRGHNLSTDRIDDRWLAPLADAVLFFARRPGELYVADTIMQSNFARSDECRKVRKALLGILTSDLDKLTTAQLSRFVEWLLADDPAVPSEVWKQVADGLRKRWSAEKQPEERNRLGEVLVQVLSSRATPPELIAFLHQQLREGPETYRAGYARKLFETLVAQPWSSEYEDEALALLDRLSTADDASERLHVEVAALYHLTDRMVEARHAAHMAKVEHPEKLTRTELKKKEDENRKLARSGFADRLRQEAGKHGKSLDPWLTVERVYLDVLLGRDLKGVAADCWAFLGEAPPAGAEATGEDERGALLDGILRERFLTTLASLATRKDAEPALVERLLKYVDRGVSADAEDGRWKVMKYRLLVALDRPKELEQALRQWVAADDPDSRWRVALAYLLAEAGGVPDAVAELEAVEKADELGPAEYRTLADWYMVLNRRDRHDRALVAAYQTMEEWRLSQLIGAHVNSWQRGEGHAPSELDPEVLLMFRALFEKSGNPAAYLWQLQQLYQATRDFRLLAVLADAVVGHSAGAVYPFLQGMQGIITDIHDEAAVDELSAHLDVVRARAKTPVDRRALDLLEAQVRRRAAELKNQPGPHVQAALSALQRAFKHDGSDGEPPLLADLLASLGAIPQQPLAAEQLRQLRELHRAAPAGAAERLHIAHRYASALWGYSRRDEATDLLQAALQERQDASDGVLPVSANDALTTLVSFFEGAGQYERGEKLLLSQLRHPAHPQQSLWLTEQLDRLHVEALRSGGEVSLGKGQTLYENLEPHLRGALGTDDHNHRRNLVNILCQVYRVGVERKLTGVKDDLRAFAFKRVGDVLQRQTSDYDSVVSDVAQAVHDLLGPADGVAFLLDRVENEPAWLRYNNQDGWSRHGWSLALWRSEAMTLSAEVDARLLKFVLAELRRDLEARQGRNRMIYDRQYSYYWKEKEADFGRAAEEVLARHPQSGASAQYVAEYLARGLGRLDRAIEVLLAAHRQKVLEEPGQALLVQYLHEANRHAESIPLLGALLGRRPDNLGYRVQLLRAYFHAGRGAELLAQLKEADAFFHDKDRWREDAMAALANGTLETDLYHQSVGYFKEVIALHERMAPRRGIGDGVLSGYYAGLARAYSGLGKTAEAVDAAGSAVVSWGRDQRNRAQALAALQQVLRDARDLDAYLASLDRQTAATGQDNPLMRKLAGQVYAERGKHPEAITQLQLAADLQPNDAETHRLLVAEFDALHDAEGAYRQLVHAVELSRRDIKLYQEMGKRLETLGRPKEVERAYTSVVEMTPNESEGHALLAEIREKENRWPDAIAEWEQVARIRALEPTGLLKLAAAQVHERQWDQAEETVKKLRSRGWPARFGNVDQQVRELEQRIAGGRKGGS
jgi:predicted Zn-dependent protease